MKMPKTICVIQFRVNSTRLKNKIFLKLHKKKTSIELLIDKISNFKLVDEIILATGNRKKNSIFKKKIKFKNARLLFGSEMNVSSRFYNICKIYKNSNIIRVTGDNPLTEIKYIKFLLKKIKYTRFKFVMMNNLKIPYGSGVEIFKSNFYLKNFKKIKTNFEKENVYEHLKKKKFFKIFDPPQAYKCHPFRVTLDTKEDYFFLKYLFNKLHVNSIYDIEKSLLKNLHNEY
jgi:spore coat polysaccharide biosynthesis protein SpsF